MALFESRRPPGATVASFAPLSVRTSDGVIFAYGNYVLQFTGSYMAVFVIAASAYLLALGVVQLLTPRLEPARLA